MFEVIIFVWVWLAAGRGKIEGMYKYNLLAGFVAAVLVDSFFGWKL